ncbi:MAG TPA: hypothetical protein VFQ44_05595 [Streptosporangiaceae bacterium]|nr:hypothetical protein [Streptosporangiaceae bacterium]
MVTKSEPTPPPSQRPSPLQNRVTPYGEIIAHPSRGMIMGNRGCIHNPDRTLGVSRWRIKMWISCVLDWNGRRLDVMPPRSRWTALFFLDEAVALSSGHRPCGYCRRADHRWFAESWRAARDLPKPPYAWEMDIALHAERVDRRRNKLTRPATFGDLPDGAMVDHGAGPALVAGGALLPWSFTGYGPPVRVGADEQVTLLTPPSIVGALAAGYRPFVHPTADQTTMRSFEGS